jgi:hypothetical protein
MTRPSPFKWLKTSPKIIRLPVMMYVRFPLSLRNVEDLLHDRSLSSRPLFKHNRAAALAEWRGLCAA